MKIEVKMFAVARQLAENELIHLDLPPDSTVGDLKEALVQHCHALKDVMSHAVIAVDAQYADEKMILSENSEVACIPPVSGG